MKEEVIAIFDIGKTNKKLLLFDTSLHLISETEEKFALSRDEDGFECDSIENIERWIKESVAALLSSDTYQLRAVNFTTYGASLVYLDGQGRRLTPVYNYLKPVDEAIPAELYDRHCGKDEFCRATASPALGMLNSGIQALWVKRTKPDLFARVRSILHLPQYLSFLLTGEICSEHTSIGCHTAIWDFDRMEYHRWVKDESMPFPEPVPVTTLYNCSMRGKTFFTGTGFHDSSASLAPYFFAGTGDFILLSTGTWCISMNPFNSEVLTLDQLAHDCLCYMDINRNPVKSSRLFMGSMHDNAIAKMGHYFKVHENSFRLVKPEARLMSRLMEKFPEERVFIEQHGGLWRLKEEPDLFVFDNFIEGYHLLMAELSDLTVESINMIIPDDDSTTSIVITGGFSRNLLFQKLIASSFPHKKVVTSDMANSTALGAAAVTLSALYPEKEISLDPGLSEVKI